MTFARLRVLSLIFLVLGSLAHASSYDQPTDHPGEIHDDRSLVEAVRSRRNVYYVEAGKLKVTQLLPDDRQGRPHQKWVTRLSDGSEITIIYNSDMGERVPVNVGREFGVGGEFIWTKQGGIVHWVHEDPKKKRPDGYVYVDGIVYGESSREKNRNH